MRKSRVIQKPTNLLMRGGGGRGLIYSYKLKNNIL